MRKVQCSRCDRKFGHGVTRVLRLPIFHFCAACHRGHRDDCDRIMNVVAAPLAA
jgi:hypothetical protein